MPDESVNQLTGRPTAESQRRRLRAAGLLPDSAPQTPGAGENAPASQPQTNEQPAHAPDPAMRQTETTQQLPEQPDPAASSVQPHAAGASDTHTLDESGAESEIEPEIKSEEPVAPAACESTDKHETGATDAFRFQSSQSQSSRPQFQSQRSPRIFPTQSVATPPPAESPHVEEEDEGEAEPDTLPAQDNPQPDDSPQDDPQDNGSQDSGANHMHGSFTNGTGPAPLPPVHALVESLLFVSGEPVGITQLARALEVDEETIDNCLSELAESYAHQNRGLRIQAHRDKYQLVTSPAAAPHIERFLNLDTSSKLSGPALETLAVVAYRQPVTRAQVEAVRGVDCAAVLRSLAQRGLVEEVGRLDAVGRPILYGVTDLFLQHFGLTGLGDLPPLEQTEADTLWAATTLAELEENGETQPEETEDGDSGQAKSGKMSGTERDFPHTNR